MVRGYMFVLTRSTLEGSADSCQSQGGPGGVLGAKLAPTPSKLSSGPCVFCTFEGPKVSIK